jgi:hypothetical protein
MLKNFKGFGYKEDAPKTLNWDSTHYQLIVERLMILPVFTALDARSAWRILTLQHRVCLPRPLGRITNIETSLHPYSQWS